MYPPRALGAARVVLLAATAVLLTTCSDSTTTSPPIGSGPMFAILDGAHGGGNEDVFFLPPLVTIPSLPQFGDRPANPSLAVEAHICELDATESGPNPAIPPCLAVQVPAIANLPMTFSEPDQFYSVNWQTGDPTQTGGEALDTESMYRIHIVVGTDNIAFRDVDPDPCVDDDDDECDDDDDEAPPVSCQDEDFCSFINGSTVPINVRIESGALCDDPDGPCASASVNLAQGGFIPLVDEDGNLIATTDVPAQNGGGAGAAAALLLANGPTNTITMQPCAAGQTIADVTDLPTFGDCIDISSDPPLPALTVPATASFCQIEGTTGLSPTQEDRVTIHTLSSLSPLTVIAMPDADAICPEPGALSNFDRLIKFARKSWRAIGDQVVAWLSPEPVWATLCNRGCAGGFSSPAQPALPAKMNYHSDNPGGVLGSHTIGTPLTAKVVVTDAGNAAVAGATLHAAGGSVSPTSFTTGSDGTATFTWTIGAGNNTLEISGFGIGTTGVQAPDHFLPNDQQLPVTLTEGTLQFAAFGTVTLFFDPQPQDVTVDAGGRATLTPFEVCTSPSTGGVVITNVVAVRNNGSFVELTQTKPGWPTTTGGDGCAPFTGVEINKTGAYRLVVNPVLNAQGKVVEGAAESLKFNVRPLKGKKKK